MKIKHIFIFFLLVFFKMHIFSSTLLLPNNVSFILNYKKLSIPVAIVFLAGLVLHDWNKNLLARKKKNYNTIKKILTLFSEAADESAEKKILSIFFLHKGKTDQKSEHLKEKLNIINSMNRELLRQNNDSLKSKEINNILKNIVDQKILLLYNHKMIISQYNLLKTWFDNPTFIFNVVNMASIFCSLSYIEEIARSYNYLVTYYFDDEVQQKKMKLDIL